MLGMVIEVNSFNHRIIELSSHTCCIVPQILITSNKPTLLVKAAEDGNEPEYKPCSLEEHLEDLRSKLNEALPSDIKIFSLLQVSNKFNAKNCTSYREYSYFLPTFMLTPLKQLYLNTPLREITEEEKK